MMRILRLLVASTIGMIMNRFHIELIHITLTECFCYRHISCCENIYFIKKSFSSGSTWCVKIILTAYWTPSISVRKLETLEFPKANINGVQKPDQLAATQVTLTWRTLDLQFKNNTRYVLTRLNRKVF